MINFRVIRYKNFLSTGDVFTEISFNSARTTLFVGANGAGKSTLLDALCFALYNKGYRNITKPQMINSVNRKDMVVELEFTIGSNDYMIRRGMKPVIFEIWQNGIMMPQDADSRDYQDYFETFILRMNYKTFCQIGILGTASFTAFMHLTPADRRAVIEDILDLQVFTSMNSVLKERIDQNKDDIKDVETDIKIINEKINLQEKYIESIQKNTSELITETEERIASYQKMVMDDNNKIIENNRTKEVLLLGVEEPKKLSGRLSKITDIYNKLTNKINSLKREISFYHDNDTCPTCKQDIDDSFKNCTTDAKSQTITEVEVALSKITEEMKTTQMDLDKANEIYSKCSDLNISNSVCMNSIQTTERLINTTKQELKKLQDRKSSIENNMNEDVLNVSLTEQLNDKEQKKSYLLKKKEMHNTAAVYLKDSGVKAKIIKKYIPIINKYINKYLAAMEFAVTFELDSTFKETIRSRHRDAFSYESFSEGEKSRINLAVLFTWREIAKLRNSAATNILIFDEIFDGSLDGTGTEEFLKILGASPNTNVIIISHKTDMLVDKFDRVLTFKKHKNFTEMEETT